MCNWIWRHMQGSWFTFRFRLGCRKPELRNSWEASIKKKDGRWSWQLTLSLCKSMVYQIDHRWWLRRLFLQVKSTLTFWETRKRKRVYLCTHEMTEPEPEPKPEPEPEPETRLCCVNLLSSSLRYWSISLVWRRLTEGSTLTKCRRTYHERGGGI